MRYSLLAFAAFVACTNPGAEKLDLVCVVGSARVCTCDGTDAGVELCSEDGRGYTECDCRLRFSSALCVGLSSPEDEHLCVAPLPTCELQAPVLAAGHEALNGVPRENGGDRTSASGAPYQTTFSVTSDTGETALLILDGADRSASAFQNQRATVTVTFATDGEHVLTAQCVSKDGAVSYSAPIVVTVDSAAPVLDVTSPLAGSHQGPSSDADPATPGQQIAVCATTSDSDVRVLCAGIGSSTPACAPFAESTCVSLDCPGGAPFDIAVDMSDAAGNRAHRTVGAITCAAATPTVLIVDPVASVPGDPTTRVLAANGSTPRKDKNAAVAGAQYLVRACSDSAAGEATLRQRFGAGNPVALGTQPLVPAELTDGCPAALAFVARFDVTLAESHETATGDLAQATTLDVVVRDVSSETGTSPTVDVWVDSDPPFIQPWYPAPICGYSSAGTTLTLNISIASSGTTATLTAAGVTYPPTGAATPIAYYPGVVFNAGDNAFRVDATELSGNTGVYPPDGTDCLVHVSNAPVVTIGAPAAFNVASDGDSGTVGTWEGTLTASVDTVEADVTVTFFQDGVALGAPVACVVAATTCTATLPVTLADIASTTITAVTSDVPSRGVGTGTLGARIVDTTLPLAVAAPSVEVADRRRSSFRLRFMGEAATYDVRYKRGEPCDNTGTRVPFNAAPTGNDELVIDDLLIENDYCFSVRAVDAAGNEGPATALGPIRARFDAYVITPPMSVETVYLQPSWVDANGDGKTDLLVGSYEENQLLIYFGSAGGYANMPDVTITGPAGTAFGYGAQLLGDLDGDGHSEIGVPAPVEGSGKLYIWKGRGAWPSALDSASADTVVTLSVNDDPLYAFNDWGYPLTPLGDFDRDGANDFAVGHYGYDWNDALGGGVGAVDVIFGVTPPAQLPAVITLPQDLGTRAITVRDDGGPRNEFGYSIVGLGQYYPGKGAAFVAQATATVTSPSLLSFAGETSRTPSVWGYNRARHQLAEVGGDQANYVRAGGAWLGTTSLAWTQYRPGQPHLFKALSSSASAGPFAGVMTTFVVSGPPTSNYAHVATCGFDGTAATVSLIGQTTPDLYFTRNYPVAGQPARFWFVTGETWARRAGDEIDLTTDADVIWDVPADISTAPGIRSVATLKDSDGDGYADFVFADGRLVVVH